MNRLFILWITLSVFEIASGQEQTLTEEKSKTDTLEMVSSNNLPYSAVLSVDVPTAPSNFVVTPDTNGVLSCELRWINPSFTVNRAPLSSLSSITIVRNGEQVEVISDPVPGAEGTWTDTNPVNGIYTYTIYATNEAGKGSTLSKTTYVGITACNDAGITVFPFAESFDEDEVCWGVRSTSSSYASWVMTQGVVRTGRFAFVHYYANGEQTGFLISPKIVVPSDGALKLSFWSFNERTDQYDNGKNSVIVATGADPDDVSHYVEVWSPTSVKEQWIRTEISLAPYAGQTIFLLFKYEGTNAHIWYVDDIDLSQVFSDADI
ncbi:MAG: choice-of-anchor J domain-containing protein [Candidatus Azobacteroides sp.]|nr:choice-of-anchor J domain-containing protein [Candidatus Azobacteroides sp.]